MEFKGTKGKWKEGLGIDLLGNNDELMQIIIFSKEVNTHNIAHVFGLSQEEVMTNALLISKAPEMLEMLKEIANQIEDGRTYITKDDIEKLIKEATEI
jgi:hypothetical protein